MSNPDQDGKIFAGKSDKPEMLALAFGNRHGLVVRGAAVQAVARAAGGLPLQVQDEAAQLVSLFAAGELRGRDARVLDACAAPGGKTFHLAELLGPGGEVVAIELHPRKAEELRKQAERRGLGANEVEVVGARGGGRDEEREEGKDAAHGGLRTR